MRTEIVLLRQGGVLVWQDSLTQVLVSNDQDLIMYLGGAWAIIHRILHGIKSYPLQGIGSLCSAWESYADVWVVTRHCFPKANFSYIRNVLERAVIGFPTTLDIIALKNPIKEGSKGKHIGFFRVVAAEKFGGYPVSRTNSWAHVIFHGKIRVSFDGHELSSQPKVCQFGIFCSCQEHIIGLQIAVDHVTWVKESKSSGGLTNPFKIKFFTTPSSEALVQVSTTAIFSQDQNVKALIISYLCWTFDCDDVLVRDSSHRFNLAKSIVNLTFIQTKNFFQRVGSVRWLFFNFVDDTKCSIAKSPFDYESPIFNSHTWICPKTP